MARSVRFHPAAEAQLFDLYAYIAADSGRGRAGEYIGRIETACLRLADFPEMGRTADELGSGFRLLGFERRAAIVYRVLEEAVEVLGVYYGGRDLAALGLPERD